MSAFPTCVVGVEPDGAGRDAAALAASIGGPDGIVLVHAYVFDPEAPPHLSGHGASLRERSEGELAAVRDAVGLDAELLAVPDPRPARALHRVASDRGADLLVVGACHRGVVGRAILGDVSRAVLHGAPCPVAVAPRGHAGVATEPRRIGVAYDGRPESRAALAIAAQAAGELGARLHLVHAIAMPEAFPMSAEAVEGWRELAEETAATARTELDAALAGLRVPADGEVVPGRPRRVLERLSEQVDLLVCGSRGWGTPRRVVLGGTADHVIHHAACPVLVVPRTAEEVASDEPMTRRSSA
jgi:nucleotide-binding universal stress UspA family protein